MLTRHDIPAMPPHIVDPSSVFNPGAVEVDRGIVLLLRVQTRGRRTFTVPALAVPGKATRVARRPVEFVGLQDRWRPVGGSTFKVFHVYDPRITPLEGELLVTTAVDTDRGCRMAIWRAVGNRKGPFGGLERLELAGFAEDRDTRNGVLFPRRVDGRYLMLERPNRQLDQGGPRSGDAIVLSTSQDLVHWRQGPTVMEGRPHYWDELIGSGPPPIEIDQGWLHVYHGVATHFQAANIYQAGAVILDRDDPSRVLARTEDNILEPRETWETVGQVPNVVFPSGLVRQDDMLHLFYGAADTCVGRAKTTVDRLVAACKPVRNPAKGD